MEEDVNEESSKAIQLIEKPETTNKNSKMSKSDKWNWSFTVIALLISAYSLYCDYAESKVRKRIEIENLINEAWDYLGGKEGEPRLGTSEIYGKASEGSISRLPHESKKKHQ